MTFFYISSFNNIYECLAVLCTYLSQCRFHLVRYENLLLRLVIPPAFLDLIIVTIFADTFVALYITTLVRVVHSNLFMYASLMRIAAFQSFA